MSCHSTPRRITFDKVLDENEVKIDNKMRTKYENKLHYLSKPTDTEEEIRKVVSGIMINVAWEIGNNKLQEKYPRKLHSAPKNINHEDDEQRVKEYKVKKGIVVINQQPKEESPIVKALKEQVKNIKEAENKEIKTKEDVKIDDDSWSNLVPKKAKKQIVVKTKMLMSHKNTEEEEKAELLKPLHEQYSPKDKFYVNDYLKYCEYLPIIKNDTIEECLEEATRLCLPYMRRVVRKVTGKKMDIVLKISSKELFAVGSSVNPKGSYGTFGDGNVKIEYNEVNKKGEIVGKIRDFFPPFFFLGNNNKIRSDCIVSIPYHMDKPIVNRDNFNIFSGFKAKYLNKSKEECIKICKPILKHIYDVWANKDKESYDYILEWLFYPIRELKKTEKMLTIIGIMGIGKSMIFDFLREFVVGDDLMLQICGLHTITAGFNAFLAGKLYVCIDETATVGGAKGQNIADFEKLKYMITNTKVPITPKGVDSYMVENNCSYCCATNSQRPVIVTGDDRRNPVFECSSEKKSQEYYRELASSWDQEMGDAFYTLARISEPLVDLDDIPNTEARKRCMEASLPRGSLFFEGIFKEGTIGIRSPMLKIIDKEPWIKTSDLYYLYKQWWNETKNGEIWSSDNFSKKIKKEVGIINDKKRIDSTIQASCYKILPELYDTVSVLNENQTQDGDHVGYTLKEWLDGKQKRR